jgi:hypothetical protein
MSNNSFRFSQKVVGQERKAIASVIAEALEGQVRYAGAPEFLYEIKDEKSAGSWTVDRDSVVHSPKISLNEIKTIRSVIDALNVEGFSAEGTMTITLSLEGFSAISLENLNNMLASKETLIKKAMLIEGELVVLAENDEISFPFWNATLNADEVQISQKRNIKLAADFIQSDIERLFPLFIQINYNTVDLLIPQSCKYFITLMSADNVPGSSVPYDRLYISKLFNRPT